jgi:hypothetical protein
MNINSLTIVRSLVQDKALRTVVAAQAEAAAKTAPDKPQTAEAVKARFTEVQQLGVSIGWDEPQRAAIRTAITYDRGKSGPAGAWVAGFELLLGWLMTMGAISLGSPLWADRSGCTAPPGDTARGR